MDVVLQLIIAASGLCAVSSHGNREYYVVYDLKNWSEAQSYCREKYKDLATIDSLEDVKILNEMVDSKVKKSFKGAWIGLYDDVDGWKWSLSDRSFYKDGETEFRRWGSGQPDSHLSQEHCTWMYHDGKWNDVVCKYSAMSVCMKVTETNVTNILISKSMTWTEAQSLCRANYTDLASVRHKEDHQKVNKLIPPGEKVWIGLFRDGWKWSDGSSSSFRNWKLSQPDNSDGSEACAQAFFNASGKWADVKCYEKSPFICYRQRVTTKQVLKLRLQKENPALDLNDPAVAEGILEQLKQKLKDQGINGGIELSWKKQPDGKVFHKEEEETKKRNNKKIKADL